MYFWGIGLLSVLVVVVLLGSVGMEAWPAFETQGLAFLWGREWNVAAGRFGALPMIMGSVAVVCTALAGSVPLGLSAAMLSAEFLSPRFRLFAKSLIELLAGVPSVVYGLLGVTIVAPWLQSVGGLLTGRTLLTGGLVLGIMVLPTFMTISDDALKAVPRELREAGWTLGLSRWETILFCVVPEALPGLLAALLLALGRALGETIAVMLLVGSLDRLPTPWYRWDLPGQTLTSKIGREALEAAVGSPQSHALAGLGVTLLGIVLLLTLFGQWLVVKRVTHTGH